MGFSKYIRSLTLLTLLSFVSTPLAAQTCVGTAGHFLQWNAADDASHGGTVYSPIVPASEVWLVDAAGLFTNDNGWADNTEWMMEVLEPIPEQTGLTDSDNIGRCCWRIPLVKQLGAKATPLAALNRAILLRPGQRMAGRTNSGGKQFGINGIYWRFPVNCGASLAAGMR